MILFTGDRVIIPGGRMGTIVGHYRFKAMSGRVIRVPVVQLPSLTGDGPVFLQIGAHHLTPTASLAVRAWRAVRRSVDRRRTDW